MKQKKITFIINYFYPDFASTGQLLTELCLELQNDFKITVVAAQPDNAVENSKKTKLFEEDNLENIKIIRIRLPKVDKTSKMSRMKYIFSYFILANIALLKQKKVDVIYTISTPPVLGGLIGTIGKLLKKSKHLYNIQDFNPEQAAAVSYTNKKLIYSIAKAIDKFNCKLSDHIIVVGNDMKETLINRFRNKRVPKYTIINNWTNEDEIIPLPKDNNRVSEFIEQHDLKGKFVIMYSGNMGLYYDLENIIKITKLFKNYRDVVFVFIGDGAVKGEMIEFVKENSINNVIFLPFQPKNNLKYSLNVANVHLVVNQKGIKGISVPSKIYGVMAAGKPILGVLEEGSEAERLISASKSGIIIEPQDYIGIKHAIEQFYNMDQLDLIKMGANGRLYLEDNLKREISINKYRKILQEI